MIGILRRFIRAPLNFLQLSTTDKFIVLESISGLFVSRILILLPFRWIAPSLGKYMHETPNEQHDHQRQLVRNLGYYIRLTSWYLPWNCKCLVQALAVNRMLKKRGIQNTVYLGVAKDDEKELIAHAWVRSGDVFITGFRGKNKFTVVSTFAWESKQPYPEEIDHAQQSVGL